MLTRVANEKRRNKMYFIRYNVVLVNRKPGINYRMNITLFTLLSPQVARCRMTFEFMAHFITSQK